MSLKKIRVMQIMIHTQISPDLPSNISQYFILQNQIGLLLYCYINEKFDLNFKSKSAYLYVLYELTPH